MKRPKIHFLGSRSLFNAWLESLRSTATVEVIIAATLLGLVVLEAGLQLRAHWQTGRSVFTALAGESRIVVDAQTGVRKLASNKTFHGANIEVRTNSRGLRGPDIDAESPEDTLRIAVAGASSIYGAKASTNDQTIPARLERELEDRIDEYDFEVINAGIPGATIENIHLLLNEVILPLRPKILIFYPGFQQISGACQQNQSTAKQAAPWVSLPNWSLVYDLIVKNTRVVREKPGIIPAQAPPEFEAGAYQTALRRLIDDVKLADATLILTTASRGYRNGLSPAENRALARNTLNFADCLTPDGLIEATSLFNRAVREVAAKERLSLIDLTEQIPGGWTYFADGNHFNDAGKHRVAGLMAKAVEEMLHKHDRWSER